MNEKVAEETVKARTFWLWGLLLLPAYFLSIIPVDILCFLYPPSPAIQKTLHWIYWPISALLASWPWLLNHYANFLKWMISTF